MKRFVPGLCLALLLGSLATAPSARAWWWHHHHKDSANNTASSKPPKAKKPWHHHQKANTGTVASLTNGPRSVGRWHPMPGPAGAGAR